MYQESYFRNNGVGIVYFDSPYNNTSGSNNSSDFLAFNNSPSSQNSFNSSYNSTPNNRQRWHNKSNRGFNHSRQSPNSSYNRNFQSPQQNSPKRYDKQMYNKARLDQYYDRSMLDNPWKILEEEFAIRDAANKQEKELGENETQVEFDSTPLDDNDSSDEDN